MNGKRFNIYWINKDGVKQDIEIVAPTFTQAIDYLSNKNPEFNKDTIVTVYSYDCLIIM